MSADRITRTVDFVIEPEVRGSNAELRIRGYAAVFDSPSEDMGFREVIEPGAFRRALADPNTDVVLNWQHDSAQPLARQSAGNLQLREDEKGLRVDAKLANTQTARDAVELVRSGVVSKMSFCFSMAGGLQREARQDGELWRYISQVGSLHDVALVTEPAYPATSAEPRGAAALEAIRRHARPRDDGPYGPDKPHSYFRDLAIVTEARATADGLRSASPLFAGRIMDYSTPHPIHGTAEAAERRLAEVEKRMLSSVAFDIFTTAPGGGPGFVGDLFAVAARVKAALTTALHHEPLPKDLNISVPRIASGAGVDYDLETQAVDDVDPTTAMVSSNVATIAGFVDIAQQDIDQAAGHLVDRAIAADLGAAYAQELEQQVINGDGTAQHLLGLLNISGPTLTTYTDATPTPAKFLSQGIGAGYAATATAYGGPIDLLVMHSRRRAWVEQKINAFFRWPAVVLESEGIPTNLGAGTQDVVLFLQSDETVLMTSGISFEAMPNPGSGTLTMRFRAHGYAALIPRLVASIGVLAGTGLAAPVWT
jgi:Escherichia/Staphylococcus phage prohead protease